MPLSKVPAASLSGLVPGSNLNQVNGVHANGDIPTAYVPGFIYIDNTATAVNLPASTAVTSFSRVVLQNTTPGAFVTVSTAAGDTVFWNGGPVTSFPLAYKAVIELMQCVGGWVVVSKSVNSPAGSILQVVSTVKTDTFTTTSSSWQDVGGLALTITPFSASSRILVMCTCAIGMGGAQAGIARLLRNGSPVFVGDNNAGYTQCSSPSFYGGSNDGNNNEQLAINYVDSPATLSAVTYKLQVASPQGGALWVNTLGSNIGNQVYSTRSAGSFIAMEIAG